MPLGDLLPSGVRIPVALFLGNAAFSFVVRTGSSSGVIKILSSALANVYKMRQLLNSS